MILKLVMKVRIILICQSLLKNQLLYYQDNINAYLSAPWLPEKDPALCLGPTG